MQDPSLSSPHDYIIIGGGIAGCALASRLRYSPASPSVLLIEAGPDATTHPLVAAPSNTPRLRGSELDWNYSTAPQKALGGRRIYAAGAKALGGGSVTNYGERVVWYV